MYVNGLIIIIALCVCISSISSQNLTETKMSTADTIRHTVSTELSSKNTHTNIGGASSAETFIPHNTTREQIHCLAEAAAENAVKALKEQQDICSQLKKADKLSLAAKAAEAATVAQSQYLAKLSSYEALQNELGTTRSLAQQQEQSLKEARLNLDRTISAAKGAKKQLRTIEQAYNTALRVTRSAEHTVRHFEKSLSRLENLLRSSTSRIHALQERLNVLANDFYDFEFEDY